LTLENIFGYANIKKFLGPLNFIILVFTMKYVPYLIITVLSIIRFSLFPIN